MWYWILQLEYFLIRSLSVAWSLERRTELWLSVPFWPRRHHEPQHFSLCHQKPHQCDKSADWPDTSRSNYWWWPGWETCLSGRSSDCSHRDDDLDEFLHSILQTVQNKRVKQTRWTFNVDKVEWFSKDLDCLLFLEAEDGFYQKLSDGPFETQIPFKIFLDLVNELIFSLK